MRFRAGNHSLALGFNSAAKVCQSSANQFALIASVNRRDMESAFASIA